MFKNQIHFQGTKLQQRDSEIIVKKYDSYSKSNFKKNFLIEDSYLKP